jgi:ADP-ribose pyrophosphatase YjhB (NUDIX family)
MWLQRAPRHGDSMVMVRRAREPGRWDLPGGAVARGESLAEAVVRSVEDDTDEVVLCGPFIGWFEVVDPAQHRVTMVFELVAAAPPQGERPAGGRAGAVETRHVPLWEISELDVTAGVTEFLADEGLIELLV